MSFLFNKKIKLKNKVFLLSDKIFFSGWKPEKKNLSQKQFGCKIYAFIYFFVIFLTIFWNKKKVCVTSRY